MARYALIVHDHTDTPPPTGARMEEFYARIGGLEASMAAEHVKVFSMGLAPAQQSRVVTADARVTEGTYV